MGTRTGEESYKDWGRDVLQGLGTRWRRLQGLGQRGAGTT